MDLNQQIQALIAGAPQDGSTPNAIAAIAPALKTLAKRLKHLEYYILQSSNEEWVVTTLSHQRKSQVTKKVIYAFATLKDASQSPPAKANPNLIAAPKPVAAVLFQMVTLNPNDNISLVFFDIPGDTESGVEVPVREIQTLIQSHLSQTPAYPPNLA
ncbi:hypothetical protein [Roseofilum casamattae]|uniref:Uncharacterized protein n=1 Tax=Roseofilum casamattae BLCC-M143 TaxID=3022442 RepID=A0ABT7C0F2_9CYAN|nr:hypothetical protein [Roseofilum casamattae]MDJ1184537.1 hypothetical protein [Roseofilum casamattae BLCC-M143]